MQLNRAALGRVGLLLLLAAPLSAQQKPVEPAATVAGTPLKVQVVFTENQGERKLSILPYTVHLLSQADGRFGDTVKLRMGVRVPMQYGKEGQWQYMDVGTNIDCRAQKLADGRFWLYVNLARTSASQADSSASAAGGKTSEASIPPGLPPLLGQFSSEMNLILSDSQTIQSIVATDPASGRTLRVEITLNVVK